VGEKLIDSVLFKDFTENEIDKFIEYSDAKIIEYNIGHYIFNQGENPKYLYILLKGAVQVEKIDLDGRRYMVNMFEKSGTIFGEVYLYIDSKEYDYSCVAIKDSKILEIPKEYASSGELEKNPKLLKNMLSILSSKAYFLNQKLLIQSSATLKQKIAKFLLQELEGKNKVELRYNRETLANYIGTTRPSLSRELSNMEEEGYIIVEKSSIKLMDIEGLKYI